GGLGFGQSGSRHNTRVLRVSAVSVFRTSPVFPTGCGPLRLSPSGKLGDPEVCSSVPPSSVRRIRLSVMWRTVQAIQLSPYRAGLAGRHRTRLPMSPAFPTCSCSLRLSPSGKSMTQKSPFELLLTASGIQHRVPRRTLSPHTAHERGILWDISISPAPRPIPRGQLCAFAGYLCTLSLPSPSGPSPCAQLSCAPTTMPHLTACRASEFRMGLPIPTLHPP